LSSFHAIRDAAAIFALMLSLPMIFRFCHFRHAIAGCRQRHAITPPLSPRYAIVYSPPFQPRRFSLIFAAITLRFFIAAATLLQAIIDAAPHSHFSLMRYVFTDYFRRHADYLL
jgi:hypothetical protein